MDHEGGCGEHFEADRCASNNKRVTFSPLIRVINSDHGGGCGPDSETSLNGNEHGSAESSDSSDTVSSSSSNSSFDDLFQVNTPIITKSRGENNILQPNGGKKPSCQNEEVNVTTGALHRLEGSTNESLKSTSQVSVVNHGCLVEFISPTLSPSIQVMEWPEGLDPNRSPASIFNSPSTRREGSATSDDSLFSIHIGNNSFSRDGAPRTGVDLYKSDKLPQSRELFKSGELCQSGEPSKSRELCQSGELHKSGELHQSTEHFKACDRKMSGELIKSKQTSPTGKGIEPDLTLDMAKTTYKDVNPGPGRTGMVDETINDVSKALMNNQVDTNIGHSGDSFGAKCQSDMIETCIQSIPLPIKKKSPCPLRPSLNCCPAFCCCKWPSCCSKWSGCSFRWFKWPNCSRYCLSWCCCKWPGCHCKRSILSSCCFKCPSWPCCKRQC